MGFEFVQVLPTQVGSDMVPSRLDHAAAAQHCRARKVETTVTSIIEALELQTEEHLRDLPIRREHGEVIPGLFDDLQDQAYAMLSMGLQNTPTMRIAEMLQPSVNLLV